MFYLKKVSSRTDIKLHTKLISGKQMKEESDSKQAQKHEVISEALLTDSLEMKSRELERFITKNEQELYESLLNNISAYEDRSYQANLSNTTKTYSLSEVLLLNPVGFMHLRIFYPLKTFFFLSKIFEISKKIIGNLIKPLLKWSIISQIKLLCQQTQSIYL